MCESLHSPAKVPSQLVVVCALAHRHAIRPKRFRRSEESPLGGEAHQLALPHVEFANVARIWLAIGQVDIAAQLIWHKLR